METLYFSRSFTSVRRSFTSIQMCHTHTHTRTLRGKEQSGWPQTQGHSTDAMPAGLPRRTACVTA